MNAPDYLRRTWGPMLTMDGPLKSLPMWHPVGPVITVFCPSSADHCEVGGWLFERLGPAGERWNKAPTISMCLGGPPGVWQDYAVADPDVAFEFKMVWG